MSELLKKIKFESIQEQVYNSLLESMINLELPPGTKLTISKLKKIYGVSSTPIRGALYQLQQEELLVSGQGKSFYVSNISETDVRNLFEIRIALETIALRQSINKIDRKLISNLIVKMRSHISNPEETKASPPYEIDYMLHTEILTKSENSYLISIIKRISKMITRMRNVIRYYLPEQQSDWIICEMEEHLLIAEKILNEDTDGSINALKKHLEHSADIICSILGRKKIDYVVAQFFAELEAE